MIVVRKPTARARCALAALVVAAALCTVGTFAEEPTQQLDMAEMMKRAREFTTPGEHHKQLERFLGEWDTELRITMGGGSGQAEKGSASFGWLIDGRWLQMQSSGTMMGMPAQSFGIIGYDNFKQSFVTVNVGSLDTAMLTSEGDFDPGGTALITYGTLDEYLTGEHDKMVKYVWRLLSEDRMVLEVHDLPIGEHNTKVLELTFHQEETVMAGIIVRRNIAAPIDRVFSRATDFSRAADMISGIDKVELLTDGPVGRGTRFRETRTMFGRPAVEEMEVTEFEPPRRYVLGCENHGCRYVSEFRLAEQGAGTEVEMSFRATPQTLLAKVMSILMRPMMGSMAKVCARDLDDLKDSCEREG